MDNQKILWERLAWWKLVILLSVAIILMMHINCHMDGDRKLTEIEINPDLIHIPLPDTVKINLFFELKTNKGSYSKGETVKIFFKIFLMPIDDANIYYQFEFSMKERLGIDIYNNDNRLVYHYPKTFTPSRDSLIVTGGMTTYLQHNWLQEDNQLNKQIECGEYSIRVALLDDNSDIQEIKITILNE